MRKKTTVSAEQLEKMAEDVKVLIELVNNIQRQLDLANVAMQDLERRMPPESKVGA